ncbi:hypothetical protein EO216_05830 [Flammeovirga kamogawensis]|uniref:Uncharacterized protein n=2 Tax=Flammeovirga kamogawensis TaxID=373891 RepID=A0ABX8GQM5_9BACT|nr:hypothetical protein [Flammeovirga kamogawensis]QWG05865.1 hypothetical protein KM029_10820 [Flammeovirga kamogawensis]TRX67689.1 hypothetical protein EO216_05830 [Flammeovirga kamogawensis]
MMMKDQSYLYPKNSPQADINRKKTTLMEQGWNESVDVYVGRLKKMLVDSQKYIDKLHKTVYDKNQKLNDMQNHIYFLEDELYAINDSLPKEEQQASQEELTF